MREVESNQQSQGYEPHWASCLPALLFTANSNKHSHRFGASWDLPGGCLVQRSIQDVARLYNGFNQGVKENMTTISMNHKKLDRQ